MVCGKSTVLQRPKKIPVAEAEVVAAGCGEEGGGGGGVGGAGVGGGEAGPDAAEWGCVE